jgi:chemotaxis protein MotB
MRRRRLSSDDGDWALTFADMMTLLLCVFVVLLSIARIDQASYDSVAESMRQAMGPPPEGASEIRAKVSRQKSLYEIKQELEVRLDQEGKNVDLEMRPDAVAVKLENNILFGSGQARLSRKARQVLAQVARPLAGTDYTFVIEGHTDDVPISSARYPSNWELSAARAAAVARQLIRLGLDSDNIEIKGLADTRPLAPNTSAANRARNRRIVILVKEQPLEPAPVGRYRFQAPSG